MHCCCHFFITLVINLPNKPHWENNRPARSGKCKIHPMRRGFHSILFQGGLTMSLVAENQQQVKVIADAEKPDMDHCRHLFHSQVVPYFLCCQSFLVEGLSMCWKNSDICFHYHVILSLSPFSHHQKGQGGGVKYQGTRLSACVTPPLCVRNLKILPVSRITNS